MQKKNLAILVSILILSIAASSLLLPSTTAHSPPWQIPTFAYVQAVINPVGVGQNTYIYMWIDKTFGTDTALTNDWRFHNYKLTITAPDGTVEVKTYDVVWDTTSSQGYSFAPNQVGTYNLKFEFPGQRYTQYSHNPNSAFVNDTYLPSSAEEHLQFKKTNTIHPRNTITNRILEPTNLWRKPQLVDGIIELVWQRINPTSQLEILHPRWVRIRTNHVMWSKQIQLSGGVVGGNTLEIPGDTFFEGSAYLNRFVNPIIMDGKIFYKEPYLTEEPLTVHKNALTYAQAKSIVPHRRAKTVLWFCNRNTQPTTTRSYTSIPSCNFRHHMDWVRRRFWNLGL